MFHDMPGEDDFYGFTGPDQSIAVHHLTSSDKLITQDKTTKYSKDKR